LVADAITDDRCCIDVEMVGMSVLSDFMELNRSEPIELDWRTVSEEGGVAIVGIICVVPNDGPWEAPLDNLDVLKDRSRLVDTSDSETADRLCRRDFVGKPLSRGLMKLVWLRERILSGPLNEAAWLALWDPGIEPVDVRPFTELRRLDWTGNNVVWALKELMMLERPGRRSEGLWIIEGNRIVWEEPPFEVVDVGGAWLEGTVALSCSPRLVLLSIAGERPSVGEEMALLKDGVGLSCMRLLPLRVPVRTAEEPACEVGREEANALIEAVALPKVPAAMLLTPFRAVDDAKPVESWRENCEAPLIPE
jgi:hypothetical protein